MLLKQSREAKPNADVQRFIHFWLGSATTPELSAIVAYKVIELDTHLENRCTQFREMQEHESVRFMSYFKTGLTYVFER